MIELNHLTIAAALQGLATKTFTSYDLTMACLMQMEKHRDLNAFVTETPSIEYERVAKSVLLASNVIVPTRLATTADGLKKAPNHGPVVA